MELPLLPCDWRDTTKRPWGCSSPHWQFAVGKGPNADFCVRCHAAGGQDPAGHPTPSLPPHARPTLVPKWLLKCCHRGGLLSATDQNGVACQSPALHEYKCDVFGTCRPLADCADCQQHTGKPLAEAGVVIGSYGMPSAVELSLAAIRHTCGDVPVLVVDDATPGDRLTTICQRYGAELVRATNRTGHAGGDLRAFHDGVKWGYERGFDVVVKLSQRLVPTRPDWLADIREKLTVSGLALAGMPCQQASFRFELRSEAVALSISHWRQALADLSPRQLRQATENVVWQVVKERFGGRMLPWDLFGSDRMAKSPHALWHCSHSDAEYHDYASQLDVALGADWTTAGWQGRDDYKIG